MQCEVDECDALGIGELVLTQLDGEGGSERYDICAEHNVRLMTGGYVDIRGRDYRAYALGDPKPSPSCLIGKHHCAQRGLRRSGR